MHVVVVESPAKSRTINKYLGKDYTVLASFGHIRDLPSKDGSVRPDEDFAMTYMLDDDKKKHLSAIVSAMKDADSLILATDPDREGEAISWHVLEALKEKKALKKNVSVKRVVFNEITKSAVLKGIEEARDIDMDLVNAQQARRALDYLVGFTLSPVLWRKLPGSKSAGRVQSVALRLICEREMEIEKFKPEEYWTIQADFGTQRQELVSARLTELEGDKLEKFTLSGQGKAKEVEGELRKRKYAVKAITPKTVQRHPSPPFITSTLQQEAARKLGFGAKKTMQLAQRLYEGTEIGGETTGLITYMRTDGVYVAGEALAETRHVIGKRFGENYVPEKPRFYSSKARNAQEAHEAIRPTSLSRAPEYVKQYLEPDQFALYDLIWKRMMASQMASAVIDQLAVDIVAEDGYATLRVTGSQVKFPGFFALYREGLDDEEDEDTQRILPEMHIGEKMNLREVLPEQHFTEPPPRYSEASLVKKLEQLGIGRPSTYAAILSVLQDRGYVVLDKKRFIPEERGRLVVTFLEIYFQHYVEYDFTAQLEQELDDISEGKIQWKEVLRRFWTDFKANVDATTEIKPSEVLTHIQEALAPHIFPDDGSGKDPRECPTCKEGKLNLKAGKFGAFLGCSRYPDCRYTRPLIVAEGEEDMAAGGEFPRVLGVDAASGQEISIRKGPYGVYVQREDPESEKPKRTSLPKGTDAAKVDLAQAQALLALPRDLGKHPETTKKVSAGIGRFGPYVLHDGVYASLTPGDDVLSVGMNRAVTLLAEKAARGSKGGRGAAPLKVLGQHPEGGDVGLYKGKYGPYVKHGAINATLPNDVQPEEITLQQALELLVKRAGSKKRPAARKKAVKAKSGTAAAKKSPGKAAKKSSPAKKSAKKSGAKDVPWNDE